MKSLLATLFVFFYFFTIPHTLKTAIRPSSISSPNPNESEVERDEATEALLLLCQKIIELDASKSAYNLKTLISVPRANKRIPMRRIIRIIRFAGMTLKICEQQKHVPLEKIQKMAELLSRYWELIWEQWLAKNVYPVDLYALARIVETKKC